MSDRRQLANRINASKSTGPITQNGKATASGNATRHGILSGRLFLTTEDPSEFQQLQLDLHASLAPVGVMELTLVERIAIAIWRQRRLVAAETASLNLNLDQRSIAKGVNAELDRTYSDDPVSVADLQPYDPGQETWCRAVVTEIDSLDDISFEAIRTSAPHVFAQIETEAEDENVEPVSYLKDFDGGATEFVFELRLWCRKEIAAAEQRPALRAIAAQVEARRMLLPQPTLELLTRYQTTLDNQLYKALNALRGAQEWRLKSIEAQPSGAASDDAVAA